MLSLKQKRSDLRDMTLKVRWPCLVLSGKMLPFGIGGINNVCLGLLLVMK